MPVLRPIGAGTLLRAVGSPPWIHRKVAAGALHDVMGRLPLPLKLAGAVLTNLEWLGMLLFPRIGEELTVIAEK